MDGNLRTTLAGFAGAIVVLAVLFSLVGIGRIIAVLSQANPVIVAILPGVVIVWLLSWGLLLRVVVSVLDGRLTVVSSVLIYTVAMFANNITPFGQAGGEPVSAYFIADATDSKYEKGLATIASVDAIHFVPSLSLAALGLASIAATAALNQRLRAAAVIVVGLGIVIFLIAIFVWNFRVRVENIVVRLVMPVATIVARLIPNRAPPDRETIVARVEGFFVAVERVATNRRSLALAFGFATAGWITLASILWLSLYALGYSVPIAIPLVVVPLGSIASITPLPGGLGGIESVLIALLVSMTGIDPAAASAAVLLHRTASYWLPTFVGGIVASVFSVQSRSHLEPQRDSDSESESRFR